MSMTNLRPPTLKAFKLVAPPDQSDGPAARGDQLVATLRELVHEGNVRRIFIDDEDGTTLIEIPLVLGVRGGVHLEPVWAAAGALSRAATKLSVRVQHEDAWPTYDD